MVQRWKSLSCSVRPFYCQCLSMEIAWLWARFYTPVSKRCGWNNRIHSFEEVSTYFCIYSEGKKYLIPCWFYTFAHWQRNDQSIIFFDQRRGKGASYWPSNTTFSSIWSPIQKLRRINPASLQKQASSGMQDDMLLAHVNISWSVRLNAEIWYTSPGIRV